MGGGRRSLVASYVIQGEWQDGTHAVDLQQSQVVQLGVRALSLDEGVDRSAKLGLANVEDILDNSAQLLAAGHVIRSRAHDQLGHHHVVLAGHFSEESKDSQWVKYGFYVQGELIYTWTVSPPP